MMLDEVRKAVDHLEHGRVILYPTDTIWGIGCDATNPGAVERIYRIKKRSDSKSMLVLMTGPEMLSNYLKAVPDQALEIIRTARKPTTIVYPGAANLAKNLIAEDGSVGIRLTNDPFCKNMIERFGKPVVSTSANHSGLPSPALFKEIDHGIVHEMDHVVNWRRDENSPATPSAIIKIDEKGSYIILRN